MPTTMEPTSPANLFTSLGAPGLHGLVPLSVSGSARLSGNPGSLSELSELSRLRLSTGSPALSAHGSQISGSTCYLGGSLNDLRITAGSQVKKVFFQRYHSCWTFDPVFVATTTGKKNFGGHMIVRERLMS